MEGSAGKHHDSARDKAIRPAVIVGALVFCLLVWAAVGWAVLSLM